MLSHAKLLILFNDGILATHNHPKRKNRGKEFFGDRE